MIFTMNGCGSGTQPIAGWHHTSYTVTVNGSVYWIDAGETCSYTAHLTGTDLLATRAVFITHTHMDHVGGLGNLFWNIRKLTQGKSHVDRLERMEGRHITLKIPEIETWEGISKLLSHTEGNFAINFAIDASEYSDGIIYQDENISVEAMHNTHLPPRERDNAWQSYSFILRAEGKKIVCTGDIKAYEELGDAYDGADLIFAETGHHGVADACAWFAGSGFRFGKLAFVHNGPSILKDYSAAVQTAADTLGDRAVVTREGMTIEL